MIKIQCYIILNDSEELDYVFKKIFLKHKKVKIISLHKIALKLIFLRKNFFCNYSLHNFSKKKPVKVF